jgi:hypothetical protein
VNTPVYEGCGDDAYTSDTFLNLPLNVEPNKTYTWTVKAKDSFGNESEPSEPFRLTTEDVPPVLSIEPQGLPKGEWGEPYSVTLQVSGGTEPYTWSIARGELPEGLSLFHHVDTSYIDIIGTPTTADEKATIFNFTIKAVDNNQNIIIQDFRISIRPEIAMFDSFEPKRYALIIGCVYPDNPYADVTTPAGEFANYLQINAQWKFQNNVRLIVSSDFNWNDLQDRLDWILSLINEGDHFLLYIGGHGGVLRYPIDFEDNETGIIPQALLSFAGYDRFAGVNIPAITFDINTNEDEFFQLPSPIPDGNRNVFDDEFTNYFLDHPQSDKWNSINKHFFFDFCFSGGFWGGNDIGDFEKLEKIGFVASTPEGFLSKAGRLWENIEEAVNQDDFDYTFESLYNYLDERSPARVYQDYPAPALPGEMKGYVFKLLQYPVTFIDNLIQDVPPNKGSYSTLGNDPRPSLLDQDIFSFFGTEGEEVQITLTADESGEYTGERATLILIDKIRRAWLLEYDRSALPNTLTATLPADGEYNIIVSEQFRRSQGERFQGDYCILLESTQDAWQTFKDKRWVE